MMYPRLKLLQRLLSDDGAIFISIDDNEQANLKLICDEIFGIHCFVTDLIWRSADSSNNDAKQFSVDYNHTLVYSKNPGWQPLRFERKAENNKHYKNPDNDSRGPWFQSNLQSPNYRANLQFDIIAPNGNAIKAPKNGWRWSFDKMQGWINDGTIIFSVDQTRISTKLRLKHDGANKVRQVADKILVEGLLNMDIDVVGCKRNDYTDIYREEALALLEEILTNM